MVIGVAAEACRTGGTTLHGTGVRPTFTVERVAMTMGRGVSHVRCVEAVDFDASVCAVLDAPPAVCAAEPGILIDDPTPHYVHDDRVRF